MLIFNSVRFKKREKFHFKKILFKLDIKNLKNYNLCFILFFNGNNYNYNRKYKLYIS